MAKRTYTLLTATLLALSMLVVSASAAAPMLDPLTQQELDDNWVADRQFPSGGVESVSFDGRDNVAKISIVGADQDAAPFKHFEGIKKVDDFGLAVQVDLYVDSDWLNHSPVNVGFWTTDDPVSVQPSIFYRSGGDAGAGFYTWDGAGYVASGVAVVYDGWSTLSITLDTENDVANYAINGQDAGSVAATGDTIGQVFLNHYNAGDRDYDAFWHAGVVAAAASNGGNGGGNGNGGDGDGDDDGNGTIDDTSDDIVDDTSDGTRGDGGSSSEGLGEALAMTGPSDPLLVILTGLGVTALAGGTAIIGRVNRNQGSASQMRVITQDSRWLAGTGRVSRRRAGRGSASRGVWTSRTRPD